MLQPVLMSVGNWGMRWAHENLWTHDYDVELLIIYLQRSIQPARLPPSKTIIQFSFSDMVEKARWWLLCDVGGVEVCDKNPGKDIDVYFNTTVKTMTDIWMQKRSYRDARRAEEIAVTGNNYLVDHVWSWMTHSPFEALPPAENILCILPGQLYRSRASGRVIVNVMRHFSIEFPGAIQLEPLLQKFHKRP